ncbi:MAG: hypothetical protein KGD60_14130 [Candidatus Thorarchaeota archaeon]|nr:hypothetical protein [Candidatus Thorarchaeota archaeon]
MEALIAMSEYPECPFCQHRLTEPIPHSLEGSINLRCPSCEQRYEYLPQIGSFPLDDDLGIKVSEGILGPHVVTGSPESDEDVSLSRALFIGGLCCCTIAIIIPVVISLILALF